MPICCYDKVIDLCIDGKLITVGTIKRVGTVAKENGADFNRMCKHRWNLHVFIKHGRYLESRSKTVDVLQKNEKQMVVD